MERSNNRDRPDHRFFYGSITAEGRSVPYIQPTILGRNTGTARIDDTFVAFYDLNVYAQKWLAGIVEAQEEAFLARGDSQKRDSRDSVQVPKRLGKTEKDRAKGKAKPKHV